VVASGSKGFVRAPAAVRWRSRKRRDLGFVQGAEPEPDAEALREGIVLGFGEALFEQRLPDEDEGEGAPAIQVIGGEQPEIFERGVGQEMGLIDEQDRALGQAAEVGDEGGRGGALEARGAEPAERGEVGDEAEGADGGERGGEDVVAGGLEALGEQGEDRAFAAAALGDEAGDRVAVEGEAEALEGRLEGRMAQQRGRGRGLGERDVGEAEVVFEGGHGVVGPFLVRSRTRCAVRASR
jgi:hypothetical protein